MILPSRRAKRDCARCRARRDHCAGQYPAGGPAAPPFGAPSGNTLLPGAAPPSGSVPSGPMPSMPAPKDMVAPISSTPQVVEVRIEGNKAVDSHKILPHIKTPHGRPLDKSIVEDDVKRLTKTHQFINVEPRYERREDGGIVIIYHVVERPLIRYVKIYGSTKSEKTLKKKAGLKEGDALIPMPSRKRGPSSRNTCTRRPTPRPRSRSSKAPVPATAACV